MAASILGWGGRTAAFAGAPGTVSVVGSISFSGLQFQTSGYTLAAGSGGVLNTTTANTAIALSTGVTSTIDAPIAGSGGIYLQGSGTLIVRGENTYTGGTSIRGGSTLQIGDGGTTGSIVGNVNNDGALIFNRSDTIAFGGEISGAGMLRQAGTGTLILTGNNTYTGGTSIGSGSTLQIGNGGTTGSIIGNVVNDGTLTFKRADTVTFGGDVSGTGQLRQDGAGTLILTGTSTYTGGTTIVSGSTLQLGAGGTSGSIIGDVANGGALVFNRSNTIGFGGRISGTGEVRQEGSGTVVLVRRQHLLRRHEHSFRVRLPFRRTKISAAAISTSTAARCRPPQHSHPAGARRSARGAGPSIRIAARTSAPPGPSAARAR